MDHDHARGHLEPVPAPPLGHAVAVEVDLQIVRALEALLFAADRPLDTDTLLQLFEGHVGIDELEGALLQLGARYDPGTSGVVLVRVAGGFQLRTAPQLGDLVGRLRAVRPMRLSRAAMETLSIVAYRQPVSRSDIEALRGVDSSGVLRSLLDLGLVRIVGRREGVGRPLIYGTDERFLSFFGLDSLAALPRLREADELDQAHLFRADAPEAIEADDGAPGLEAADLAADPDAERDGDADTDTDEPGDDAEYGLHSQDARRN